MVKRGCGERVEGGLYVIAASSPYGKPLEFFLIDPVVEWKGGQLRAPMLYEDSKGIYHILMGVGKTFYPFVPDFVEEVRIHGLSKRIPIDFDVSKLTPLKSKILLIHPRAIPKFEYEVEKDCPKEIKEEHLCIGDLWSLSSLKDFEGKHKVNMEGNEAIITTPSTLYRVKYPKKPNMFIDKYKAGVFLQLPIGHLEYVSKKKEIPKELKEIIDKSKIELKIVEE
jgi:hypothetical protein